LLQSGRRMKCQISGFRFHKPAIGQIVLPATSGHISLEKKRVAQAAASSSDIGHSALE
jgi:hypothetical protein